MEPPPETPDNGGAQTPAPLLSPGKGAGLSNPMAPGGGVKRWSGMAGAMDREKVITNNRKKRRMRTF